MDRSGTRIKAIAWHYLFSVAENENKISSFLQNGGGNENYNIEMEVKNIIATIDSEIGRLKQVRSILSGETARQAHGVNVKERRAKKKRTLSPEARKRIAEAQRKRWAAQKSGKSK